MAKLPYRIIFYSDKDLCGVLVVNFISIIVGLGVNIVFLRGETGRYAAGFPP